MCMYPHQGIASFHPTSKDGLCGAYGRKNGSIHLCHIYCKIKQWIHGDDKSNMLIKIVHMCGRWMVEMEYSFLWISLPFIWITWGHGNMTIFFSWTFCVQSFFLGHASWACHLFSLFFSIAHASIERYEREREIIKHRVLFCGWMEYGS